MLNKIVDGVEVEMSPEEAESIQAEWAANDAASKIQPAVKTLVEQIIASPKDLADLKAALAK